MAASILTFPHQRPAAPTTTLIASTPEPSRFQGLHLVNAGTTATRVLRDTQAQAIRIVAQVEQEIARQVARQRQAAIPPKPAPVAFIPEPSTNIAAKLLSTLFSFARTA